MSWLFSGAETGIYQLSRLRLRIGIEKKMPLSLILGDVLRDGPGLLISILVGNNLANYIITSCVT
jgi:Mg2+/Co2+ transporter CorB